MSNLIIIKNAPKQYQKYLGRGDDPRGEFRDNIKARSSAEFQALGNGRIDSLKEAEIALFEFKRDNSNKKAVEAFAGYLNSKGWPVSLKHPLGFGSVLSPGPNYEAGVREIVRFGVNIGLRYFPASLYPSGTTVRKVIALSCEETIAQLKPEGKAIGVLSASVDLNPVGRLSIGGELGLYLADLRYANYRYAWNDVNQQEAENVPSEVAYMKMKTGSFYGAHIAYDFLPNTTRNDKVIGNFFVKAGADISKFTLVEGREAYAEERDEKNIASVSLLNMYIQGGYEFKLSERFTLPVSLGLSVVNGGECIKGGPVLTATVGIKY